MERTISYISGVGTSAQIIQHSTLLLPALYIERPYIILVKQGCKVLYWRNTEYVIQAGEAVAINAGITLDILNSLSPGGVFVCQMLSYDPQLIRDFSPASAQNAEIQQDCITPLRQAPPTFTHAFDHTFTAIASRHDIPATIIRHRMQEMLLWMTQLGVQFSQHQEQALSLRVRRCLTTAPQRVWSAAEVAASLALSEAVLRRRLAKENTALRHLLTDVRMTFALRLLQATSLPISEIASKTGYESSSRFAERFRKRFGFAPTAIRGHQRQVGGALPVPSAIET